ncbi:lipid II flippase MurJ [Cryobacterium roopkundense]|uniref:O-antigen/teichoic acid export membrane protein n=1 Tax=Cryobacterium roopkundense TaxID=1001240 RepID=A0A7W8ZYC2_9MICO|nr:O-antigen/teichoic acid export membrane protein [Cryobacterium roopkundense]
MSRDTRRAIDRFMMLGVVGTVSSAGFLQTSILVATAVNGLSYAGEYAAALTLTTPISLIAGATSLALFPAMARDHGRDDLASLKKRTQLATQTLVTLMIAAFGVIGILAGPITLLVWGKGFQENTDEILMFLLLAVVVGTIAVPSVNLLTTQSNRGMATSAISSLIGFAIGIAVWIALVPTLPEHAVPIGYLVGASTIAGIPYVIIWRRYQLPWLGQTLVIVSVLTGIVSLIVLFDVVLAPFWVQASVALLFLVLWSALRVKNVKQILRLLRSSFGGHDRPRKALA